MIDPAGIESLYAHVAPLYDAHVIPAFGPLADDLADWIIQCLAAHQQGELYDPFELGRMPIPPHPAITLDIGTGTGILARSLLKRGLPTGLPIIGLDLSVDMLTKARGVWPLLASNVHDLPIRRQAVHLAVSSLGLNTTTPKRSLREIARVLRPGSLLMFQEWGVEDPLSSILETTLEEFGLETGTEIDEADPALRTFYDTPNPWYARMEDTADYYEMLKGVGFDLVWVKEAIFTTVRLTSVTTFINSKMAWPSRRLPFLALSPDRQALLLNTLSERLGIHANPDGSLDWSPSLFRVCAVRG